jgi:hypothetical protein
MPLPDIDTSDMAALARQAGFRAQRASGGWILDFPILRAPGPAACLAAFALLCGLMPALGLSALLPLPPDNASAMVSLALIGGFAAPFIVASIVFAALAVYLLANSLHVEITADGVSTERRVFGHITRRRAIASGEITDIEPRIAARYQNVFSATPRYALIAVHTSAPGESVVIAEDLAGQPLMQHVRDAMRTALN